MRRTNAQWQKEAPSLTARRQQIKLLKPKRVLAIFEATETRSVEICVLEVMIRSTQNKQKSFSIGGGSHNVCSSSAMPFKYFSINREN